MIFLDTSAIYAWADTADANHSAAVRRLRRVLEDGESFVTHNYVLVESLALLQSRLGLQAAVKLSHDAKTFVIDWEDFRELQLSYLRASVIDIEVLTDHAIYATLYRFAMDHDIPFILSGANEATEGILPFEWVYLKKDHVNIRAIHRAFGTGKLRSYPMLDFAMKRQIERSGIEIIELEVDQIDSQLRHVEQDVGRPTRIAFFAAHEAPVLARALVVAPPRALRRPRSVSALPAA